MAEEEPERATGSGRGRGPGLRLAGRRPHTWEISDSDSEGTAARVVGPQASSTVGELRATTKALRPDQVLKNLVVCVDPGEGRGTQRLGTWSWPPNRIVSPIVLMGEGGMTELSLAGPSYPGRCRLRHPDGGSGHARL